MYLVMSTGKYCDKGTSMHSGGRRENAYQSAYFTMWTRCDLDIWPLTFDPNQLIFARGRLMRSVASVRVTVRLSVSVCLSVMLWPLKAIWPRKFIFGTQVGLRFQNLYVKVKVRIYRGHRVNIKVTWAKKSVKSHPDTPFCDRHGAVSL